MAEIEPIESIDVPPKKVEATKKVVKGTTLTQDIFYLVLKILGIAGVITLLFIFVFGIFRYPDDAMAPSIRDGDLVVSYRFDKDYVASDTIVLNYQGKQQVRRVVAVAGDTVDITADGLTVNGLRQLEPGIYQETTQFVGGTKFPIVVKEGQVFVLGDARKKATDSRVYGCVDIKDTQGKVIVVIRRRGI